MRVLDVAVAAMIGVSSLSLLAYSTPYPYQVSSAGSLEQAALRDRLLYVAGKLGIPYMEGSTFGQLCAALSAYSNSTVMISAAEGNLQCADRPAVGYSTAVIEVPIGSAPLELWAWSRDRR